ncbi:MAG: TAXI family TRAP transporter solute-binding subunit, partial [Rhodospirillales bacterium]|nr:TAXI family TRAP transporter solute-binding subunit [Rhodospirillales bacterium]
IAMAGVVLIAWFVEPAPPKRVGFAAGVEGGAYQRFASKYAEFFAKRGIRVDVIETAGSIENAELLIAPESDIDAALLQGGTVLFEQRDKLEAVVAVFFEPLWVFVRPESSIDGLDDMRGKRINVGPEGSGTRVLALDLLKQSGITPDDVMLVDETIEDSVQAMEAGSLDAMFLVVAPSAPVIADLLESGKLKPLTLPRLRAFDRRDDSLSVVKLYQGSIDPARHLPREDLELLASSAVIAVRPGTHQAVVQLLVLAAAEVHREGSLLNEPDVFPNTAYTSLLLDPEADDYLEKGETFLQRTLPFWLASLIERLVILALPLLALLLPLGRALPPVYRWRIRSRIYKWYATLREIDARLREGVAREALEADARKLVDLEKELGDIDVPLSYMEEFYHLRLHIDLIHTRLSEVIEGETEEIPSSCGDADTPREQSD